jgi:hypothetical protein
LWGESVIGSPYNLEVNMQRGLLILAAGMTALASVTGQQPASNQQMVLYGPFPLGDLYFKAVSKNPQYGVHPHTGIDPKALEKAMNQCKVYVLDWKRQPGGKGPWILIDYDIKTRPKVLLEGPLSFTLTGRQGQELRIQVQAVKLAGMDNDARRLSRKSCIYFRLEKNFLPPPQKEDQFPAAGMEVINLLTETLTWDVQGKTSWKE